MKKAYSAKVLYGRSYEEISNLICDLGLVGCDPSPHPFLALHFSDQNSLLHFVLRFHGMIEVENEVAVVSAVRIQEVEQFLTDVMNGYGFERFDVVAVEFWGPNDQQVLEAALGFTQIQP